MKGGGEKGRERREGKGRERREWKGEERRVV